MKLTVNVGERKKNWDNGEWLEGRWRLETAILTLNFFLAVLCHTRSFT